MSQHHTMKSHVRRKVRASLHAENPNCHWCGKPTVLPPRGEHLSVLSPKRRDRVATIEHLVPLAEGGDYRESNLTIACLRCNNQRSVDAQRMANAEVRP